MPVGPSPAGHKRWIIMSDEVTDHEPAEEARRESEAQYRRIVENTGEAIVILQDNKVVFVNPRLSDLYGYAPDEVLSRPFTDFIHPDDLPRIFERYQQRLAGELREPITECRLIDKAGAVRWTEFNSDLIQWEGRSAILTLFRDVTDRKHAEEALQEAHDLLETRVRERTAELEAANARLEQEVEDRRRAEENLTASREQFKAVVQSSPLAMAAIDEHGRLEILNDKFTEMLGYGPGDIPTLDRWWTLAYPDEDYRETVKEVTLRTIAEARAIGGTSPTRDWKVTKKDGEVIDIQFHSRSIGDRTLFILVDTTERKRAEEKLRESEERYRFLAENMADIVWTMDLSFQTTYVSPSVEKVLGFTPAERKKQTLEEMLPPESQQRAVAALMEELQREDLGADPERPATIEVQYFRRDGSTLWMENSLKALRDESGALIGMYGSSRDISKRKQAEEERERLIGELQKALVNIKTLRGLIPICSNCKKIRDDKGYWQQVEVFVRDHSEAEFSHGICPECMKKLYPSHDKDSSD